VVGQTFFPSMVKKITVQVSTFVHVKDLLRRVAICELVEVDDEIFRRQRIDNMERIFVR